MKTALIDNFNKRFKKLTTIIDKTELPQWSPADRIAVKLLLLEHYNKSK